MSPTTAPRTTRTSLRTGARLLSAAFLLTLTLTVTATSCSSDTKSTSAIAPAVTKATLSPGDPVPVPTGKPILTITGRISHPNVGKTLQLDLATIERLGLHQFTADDYQAEGGKVRFRGVLLSDLLALAGVSKDARTLKTVALNDYKADVPISDSTAYPTLLATSVNGRRMPVSKYGPTRIVYPNLDFSFDKTIYDPRWVWQLATIDVA